MLHERNLKGTEKETKNELRKKMISLDVVGQQDVTDIN